MYIRFEQITFFSSHLLGRYVNFVFLKLKKFHPFKLFRPCRQVFSLCGQLSQTFATLDWTVTIKNITRWGHFIYSWPIGWYPCSPSGGRLIVHQNNGRMRFCKIIGVTTLLDSLARIQFALTCNYGGMEEQEILEMFVELFSRLGSGLVSIHPIFSPEYHVALVNNILRMDERMSK